MAKKKEQIKKKDSDVQLLIIITILALCFAAYYYINNNKKIIEKKKETEITHTEEEINDLYSKAYLPFEYDYFLNKEDISKMDEGLISDDVTNNMFLLYGLKSAPKDKMIYEGGAAQTVDKEGYKYTNTYIKATYIQVELNNIFGVAKYNNKSLKTLDHKYIYDSKNNLYRIYEKQYVPNIEKVTHIEYDYDESNIYIYEYVAYTRLTGAQQTSYTRHNKLLPINITEENITENLDIIDKYKYTFSFNKNVKKYLLSEIQYMGPVEIEKKEPEEDSNTDKNSNVSNKNSNTTSNKNSNNTNSNSNESKKE